MTFKELYDKGFKNYMGETNHDLVVRYNDGEWLFENPSYAFEGKIEISWETFRQYFSGDWCSEQINPLEITADIEEEFLTLICEA